MKNLKITILLALLSVNLGCASVNPISVKDNVYTFSFADVTFSTSAEVGGRIISFKSGGKEILTTDSINKTYYGASFWVSPQSDYWPQDANVDKLPYIPQIKGKTLKLTSQIDNARICITKGFSVSEKDTAILINCSVRNISAQPLKLAPWDVARVYGGLSFFPVGEADEMNKSDVIGTYEENGIVWYPFPDERFEKGQKLFSTGKGGWMAHYYQGLLFVKCFPDIKPNEVPPIQGEVEIFVAPKGRYLELENHGKYVELKSQESLAYKQKWFLRTVGDKTKEELLSIIQQLEKETY